LSLRCVEVSRKRTDVIHGRNYRYGAARAHLYTTDFTPPAASRILRIPNFEDRQRERSQLQRIPGAGGFVAAAGPADFQSQRLLIRAHGGRQLPERDARGGGA